MSLLLCSLSSSALARDIVDGIGRSVTVPDKVERIICSGSGALRLATYLKLSHKVVGVDSIEKRHSKFDARPYFVATPEYSDRPLFGEFRGRDNPELIITLDPSPQVIFKTSCSSEEADKLQTKTGIPVVVLNYGNLLDRRADLYRSIEIMGLVADAQDRASSIVKFFDSKIDDLKKRTDGKTFNGGCYIGGIAFKGPHGIESTEPGYPPFAFVGVKNVAAEGLGAAAKHATVSKEALLQWNPKVLFVDLSTMSSKEGGAIEELRKDSLWSGLSAVENGRVYGLLPYNWYTQNFGNILIDSYCVGKILFPQSFEDVDLHQKADEIYSFLVGKPVFKELNSMFKDMAFTKIDLED